MSVYLIKVFNSLNERVSGLDNLANNDLFAVYAVKLTSLHNCTWNCWPEQNICENLSKLIFQWKRFFCFCFFVWFGFGRGDFFTIFCSWIFYTYQTFTWSEVFSKLRKITEIYRIFKSLQLYYLLHRSGGSWVFNEST